MAEEIKLLVSWSSPFAWRVIWALKFKGIQYDLVMEDLSNKSALLLEYNPIYKKIPVFVHNGKPIAESLVILECIDETRKSNLLFPQNCYERAMARFWAKFGDDKVLPSVWGAFLRQGKEQEEYIIQALESLKYLEEELSGKKYFGGETIGLIDIVLGWLAIYVNVLEEATDLRIITEDTFPSLFEGVKVFSDSPLIRENQPPRDKLITRFHAHFETYHTKALSRLS